MLGQLVLRKIETIGQDWWHCSRLLSWGVDWYVLCCGAESGAGWKNWSVSNI
jgi:hypothetical protein